MIKSEVVEKAVYKLCVQANTILQDSVFTKLVEARKSESNSSAKQALDMILNNAKTAMTNKMPLCQDTGVVVIFLGIGKDISVENISEAINNGVKRAYKDNYFRKSIVRDSFFDRTNTENNLPVIIYPEFSESENLEIEVLIKGGGAENMSATAMLSPTADENEIIEFVVNTIKKAGSKPCPPLFLGLGLGGTMEYAGLLSKKALCQKEDTDKEHAELANKIKSEINKLNIGVAGFGGENTVLDVKVLSKFSHIASLPVALTVNCHSSRHAKCIISKDNAVHYEKQTLVKEYIPTKEDFSKYSRINSKDVKSIRELKCGENILLTGEIYTSRDAGHKRLFKMIKNGEELPFKLKDSIIFYAGPCPSPEDKPIGSVGPTTSSRMDKFTPILYENELLATIGKGERSKQVIESIKKNSGVYFTVIGGIASLLAQKVVKRELIAFEDLGTEAIYKLEVKDFPLKVAYAADFKAESASLA